MIPTWIGPLIGLVSLSLAVTFFVLARRARLKGPSWAIRSNNLVRGFGSRLPELEILFRKNKVSTLTVSRIAIWNRGAATIDRNDIATADPLRISPTGSARLLDAKLVQVSGDSSQFEAVLNEDGTAAHLRFDFLDRHHGAVVQVIHTGASGADLSVIGTIKGAGAPLERKIRPAYFTMPLIKKYEPRIRRRITILCELTALAIVVVTASSFLLSWLFPSQWAAPQKLWDTFQKTHPFLGGLLTFVAFPLVYFSLFLVLSLVRPTLPVSLMSLVDDPLEQ